MKKQILAVTILFASIASLAQVQDARRNDPVLEQAASDAKQQYISPSTSSDATSTCSYNFTSGSGNTYLKYCVTKNGNIVQFQSPSGTQYISKSPAGEGYGFCDYGPSTQYYDYAGYGDSGNWQSSTKVSSSSTSVKISRKTMNGNFTLTQTIAQNAGSALAQITMALENNTSSTRHISLMRYADVDAEGFKSNSFDYTLRTAFGYIEDGKGLQLRFSSGSALNGGITQDIPGGPNPCQPFLHELGPISGMDGSITMDFDMMIPAHSSKTVVVEYKSF
jgi:hypothetical protein